MIPRVLKYPLLPLQWLEWRDLAKGIAMILVVIGHVLGGLMAGHFVPCHPLGRWAYHSLGGAFSRFLYWHRQRASRSLGTFADVLCCQRWPLVSACSVFTAWLMVISLIAFMDQVSFSSKV